MDFKPLTSSTWLFPLPAITIGGGFSTFRFVLAVAAFAASHLPALQRLLTVEGHFYLECKKPRDIPAKCINCNGPHPASYFACPKNPNFIAQTQAKQKLAIFQNKQASFQNKVDSTISFAAKVAQTPSPKPPAPSANTQPSKAPRVQQAPASSPGHQSANLNPALIQLLLMPECEIHYFLSLVSPVRNAFSSRLLHFGRRRSCRHCGEKHNSLLHSNIPTQSALVSDPESSVAMNAFIYSEKRLRNHEAALSLLATATVRVSSADGKVKHSPQWLPPRILLMEQIHNPGMPVLQKTRLGWIVAGHCTIKPQAKVLACHSIEQTIDRNLERFWEIEECEGVGKVMSKSEQFCEDHFVKTTNQLGLSRDRAYKRLLLLEKRLLKDKELKREYVAFLDEYKDLGHMTKNDLLSILLNFRMYPFVINAEITKMYRQVLVEPSERKLQIILWKNPDDLSKKVECFELNTVTYGCASSPFLAVRAFHQLGLDFKEEYPQSGLLQLQTDIVFILSTAGFKLRKWLSNATELMSQFEVDKDPFSSILPLGESQQSKTLGIFWDAVQDSIHYSIKIVQSPSKITKRVILSIIAQIFDPLGLLSPVVLVAKLILQSLWQEKLSWDESIPQYLADRWSAFCNDLQILNLIHAIADASKKAYGSCVYLICLTATGEYISSLLMLSKSRVAPIKKITLPRIELCAAYVTVTLVQKSYIGFEVVQADGKPLLQIDSHKYKICRLQRIGIMSGQRRILQIVYPEEVLLLTSVTQNYAPNFGGLWEASDKSFKYHLKRIVGDASLTYEDLCTVLIQIEGVLNSRPLSPLSTDPKDLTPFTPAHFLVGKPLTAIPEPDHTIIEANRLNNLVIIKEDNVLVSKWKTGRLVQLHPGRDGIKAGSQLSDPTPIIQSDEDLRAKWYWAFNAVVHIFPPAPPVSVFVSDHVPILLAIRWLFAIRLSEGKAIRILGYVKVRKYSVLYDQAREQYRNSEYKDLVWKKIAKALNAEDTELQDENVMATIQPSDGNADEVEFLQPTASSPVTTATSFSVNRRFSQTGHKRQRLNAQVGGKESASAQLMVYVLAEKEADSTKK
ncbi:hypothetical protein HUJ04_005286 [Dendroctonus ponderosae]|nr:hypothetical protein HUJ04_005286 [Dendroctonus ponderosae]